MDFSFLWEGLLSITGKQALMYLIGAVLIYLAIVKGYEPALLMPMGFGAILVNLPLSGVINQYTEGLGRLRASSSGCLRRGSAFPRRSPSCCSSASGP